LKSTTNSIAVSGRWERAVFEEWFLQETVDIAGDYGLDCLTGCYVISSSRSEFSTQQSGKGPGGLIQVGNASG